MDAQQDGERQHLFGDDRRMQERKPGHQEAVGPRRFPRTAQGLDKINGKYQKKDAAEHGEHRSQKAPAEITREDAGDHRRVATLSAARRAVAKAARERAVENDVEADQRGQQRHRP